MRPTAECAALALEPCRSSNHCARSSRMCVQPTNVPRTEHLGSFFARVSLEYAKLNCVIKQRLTTAEIRQCFRTFHPPFVLIEQGADGRQAGLKVERRVRVERA